MRFVLDASASFPWFILATDEQRAYSEHVAGLIEKGYQPLVPMLWRLETAHVLLRARRGGRGKLSAKAHAAAISTLDRLAFAADDTAYTVGEISAIAKRYGLTPYDAVYLHLAETLAIPLATVDGGMATAAKRAGVKLL